MEIVCAHIAAVSEGDEGAMHALYDSEFEMTEAPATPGAATVSGPEGMRRYLAGWRRNWAEWSWEPQEFMDLPPDRVLVVARLWLRGLRGGVAVERHWAYVFTLRDGKLIRQDGFDDKDAALEAVGLRE